MSTKRVFEQNNKGLLVEIDPKKIDEKTKDKTLRLIHLGAIYVVMTDEEAAKFKVDQEALTAKAKAREVKKTAPKKQPLLGRSRELAIENRKLKKRLRDLGEG